MNRKLILFDVVLAALVVHAGFQLSNQWLAGTSREAGNLRHNLPSTVPSPFTPLVSPHGVLPSRYAGIAQKTLLDRSRNADIVVEVPPLTPPVLVPPLPVYHGMMNLGDGPMAILSESGTKRQQAVRLNGDIGPFKLVGLSTVEITLEWQGGIIHDMLDEISGHGAAQPDNAPVERTEAPPPPFAAPAVVQSTNELDANTSGGIKACEPGDTNLPGTIAGGFRKVVNRVPYGEICFWQPLAR